MGTELPIPKSVYCLIWADTGSLPCLGSNCTATVQELTARDTLYLVSPVPSLRLTGHVTSLGLQDISNVCGHLSVGGLVLRGTALGM